MASTSETASLGIPFVRITLLGASGVGKTRLVDSYINQTSDDSECLEFLASDTGGAGGLGDGMGASDGSSMGESVGEGVGTSERWDVKSTLQSDIYYRLARVADDKGDGLSGISGGHEERAGGGGVFDGDYVLVEMEDTPGSDFRDSVASRPRQPGSEGALETLRATHWIQEFLKMDRTPPLLVPEPIISDSPLPSSKSTGQTAETPTIFAPFSIFNFPRHSKEDGSATVEALTQGRMAFFLIFSATSLGSLQEAKQLYALLNQTIQRTAQIGQVVGHPLVFLVANKIDLRTQKFQPVIDHAAKFATQVALPFFKVSASTGEGVNRLFTEAAVEAAGVPHLSAFDIATYRAGGEVEEGEGEDDEGDVADEDYA